MFDFEINDTGKFTFASVNNKSLDPEQDLNDALKKIDELEINILQ